MFAAGMNLAARQEQSPFIHTRIGCTLTRSFPMEIRHEVCSTFGLPADTSETRTGVYSERPHFTADALWPKLGVLHPW